MYRIKIVEDHALPDGHDFAFVRSGCDAFIFYRRSTLTAEVLEQSWAAYRALLTDAPPLLESLRLGAVS